MKNLLVFKKGVNNLRIEIKSRNLSAVLHPREYNVQ